MNRIVLPAAFLMLGLISTTAFGQEAAQVQEIDGSRFNRPRVNTMQAPAVTYRAMATENGQVAWAQNQRRGNGVASLMKKYKQAEGRDDKDDVVAELREMLSEQYEKSLEAQEKRLSEMEEKLKKLRSQLDKRSEAKDEIVDLRIDVLVKEAEGLGWPDSRTQSFFEPFYVPGIQSSSNLTVPMRMNVPRPVSGNVADPFGQVPGPVSRPPVAQRAPEPSEPGTTRRRSRSKRNDIQ